MTLSCEKCGGPAEEDEDAAFFAYPFFKGGSIDGECCETAAVSTLLREDVLFIGEGRSRGEETVGVFVGANDVFAWGCADAECLPYGEIAGLFKAWHGDKEWGVIKWLCRRRNQRPQGPVEKEMREAGVWDEGMEAIGANTMDAEVHALMGCPLPEEP
jgi:hypothetical protein